MFALTGLSFLSKTLANFTVNGSALGTAAATVDAANKLDIPQTTANIGLTIPSPTINRVGQCLLIHNSGTTGVAVGGVPIEAGFERLFIWNGTAWVATVGSGILRLITRQVFSAGMAAPGTFVSNALATHAVFEIVGGGGGGGGATGGFGATLVGGSGGGSGAYLNTGLLALGPQGLAGTINYQVGVSGTGGGPGNGVIAGTGGTTTITINGITYSAAGGFGGVAFATGSATFQYVRGGLGGAAPVGGLINIAGAAGSDYCVHFENGGGQGWLGLGACSPLQAPGGYGTGYSGGVGTPGAYGSGGGGAARTGSLSAAGGAGGAGAIIISWFQELR